MPDYTKTSYYYGKFSDISQMSLKNMPYCDESFSDLLSQCNVSLSSLNINTLETGVYNLPYLQQYETPQKKHYRQLQRSHTSCTDTKSRPPHPELTAICGKPDTKKPNWQDLKWAVPVPKTAKSGSPGNKYVTEEPSDGSSTSKSSSSCDRSDSWHSCRTSNKHSCKNSKSSNSGDTSAATPKCHNGGNKAQKKGGKLLEPQGNNTTSAHKGRPHEDESYRQPHKVLNSEYSPLRVSPAAGENKQHSVKPVAPVAKRLHDKMGSPMMPHQNTAKNSKPIASTAKRPHDKMGSPVMPHQNRAQNSKPVAPIAKLPHDKMGSPVMTHQNRAQNSKPVAPVAKLPHDKIGCPVMPHQNSAQNSELLTKTEVGDNADYQIDTSKFDDTARLEIFKLRSRIKKYTEGSDNPMLRKFHTARAQNLNPPVGKILMPKSQTTADCRSGYQSLSVPKSQVQCTRHPPLIQKSLPQMVHPTPVKKKRRNLEICDQLPEKWTETARCITAPGISSAALDSHSRDPSSNVWNRTEPCIRDSAIRSPTHLSEKRIIYQKETGAAKSVPQHTLAKNQMDAAEQGSKQYDGNCQLEPKSLKRNQLRRPVPGQRPLYNYDQLPYQASEVYPDLLCELEERLSAINTQHASSKSFSPLSK